MHQKVQLEESVQVTCYIWTIYVYMHVISVFASLIFNTRIPPGRVWCCVIMATNKNHLKLESHMSGEQLKNCPESKITMDLGSAWAPGGGRREHRLPPWPEETAGGGAEWTEERSGVTGVHTGQDREGETGRGKEAVERELLLISLNIICISGHKKLNYAQWHV